LVGDISTGKSQRNLAQRQKFQRFIPLHGGRTGGGVINWAANDTLVMASEADGWQHLYALSANGGAPKLLTSGKCEVEQWSFTPDKKEILYNSNCERHRSPPHLACRCAGTFNQERTRGWSPISLA